MYRLLINLPVSSEFILNIMKRVVSAAIYMLLFVSFTNPRKALVSG